jgi:hypothetical protein
MNSSQTHGTAPGRHAPRRATIVASAELPTRKRPEPDSGATELNVAELVAQVRRAVRLVLARTPTSSFSAAQANAVLTITGRLTSLVGDMDRFRGRHT